VSTSSHVVKMPGTAFEHAIVRPRLIEILRSSSHKDRRRSAQAETRRKTANAENNTDKAISPSIAENVTNQPIKPGTQARFIGSRSGLFGAIVEREPREGVSFRSLGPAHFWPWLFRWRATSRKCVASSRKQVSSSRSSYGARFRTGLGTRERVIGRLTGVESDCKTAARRSRMLVIAK
jgi:hypothetical protein